jgi:beta-glucosidase
MILQKNTFGSDFKWGVSTAAFQIEGAHNKDGKGISIWDDFSRKKNKIFGNHAADTACDFYHRYVDDILLIKKLNIPNYRFSVSWSRILPLGTGSINIKGIDFYNKVIDFCLNEGIEPWITIYHWDLPKALEDKGGWTHRSIIEWFGEYVHCCIKYFGDRVKYWMVLNEPMVFTGAGYFLGVHAPGKKGLSNFLSATHHAALCQAAGGKIIRSMRSDCIIGTTFSYSHIEPFRKQVEKDMKAAIKTDALLNRLFLEPLLGLGYPVKELPVLKRLEKFIHSEDEKNLVFEMDFIGIQNYTREVVKYAPFMPFVKSKIIKANKRNVTHTQMNWEVHPPAIYEAIKRIDQYPQVKKIIITENGAAFDDNVCGDIIEDHERTEYIRDHIFEILKAKNEGAKVEGYFVWTLMDNFEWAEGYRPKFGLVSVDRQTQKRIIKQSGKWYSDFLSEKNEQMHSTFINHL